MKLKSIITAVFLMGTAVCAFGQKYYCNPLPMPIGQGGNASGDVTVIEEGGIYFLCC